MGALAAAHLERKAAAPDGSGGRLVCTNHLLRRWPEGTELPADDGALGTAAFTYDRDDIRKQ